MSTAPNDRDWWLEYVQLCQDEEDAAWEEERAELAREAEWERNHVWKLADIGMCEADFE